MTSRRGAKSRGTTVAELESSGEEGESEDTASTITTIGTDSLAQVLLQIAQNQAAADERREAADKQREEATLLREQQRDEAEKKRLDADIERRAEDRALLIAIQKKQESRDMQDIETRRDELQLRKATLTRQQQMDEKAKLWTRPKDIPPIGRLRERMDLVWYLKNFKTQMLHYEVNPKQWGSVLKPLLDDKTASFMERLEGEVLEKFEELEPKLIAFNGITPMFFRQMWEELEWSGTRTIVEHLAHVDSIWTSWTSLLSRDELSDMMVRDKFVTTIPPQVRGWVRDLNPDTKAQALKLAVDYTAQHWRNTKQPAGSNLKSVPTKRPYDTPTPGEQYKAVRGSVKCSHCGIFGHTFDQCRRAKRTTEGNPSDHNVEAKKSQRTEEAKLSASQDLPVFQGFINDLCVHRLTKDSGCTRSHIHPNVLPDGFHNEGSLKVRPAFGPVKSFPTTSVTFRIGKHTWTTRVIVNGELNYDALLGRDIPGLTKARKQAYRQTCTKKKRRSRPSPASGLSQQVIQSPKQNSAAWCGLGEAVSASQSEMSTDSTLHDTSSDSDSSISTGPRDNPIQSSIAETTSDSDDPSLVTPNQQRSQSRHNRRIERQQYRQKWGTSIDLNGGVKQLIQSQRNDHTLQTPRNHAETRLHGFYWGSDEVLYRQTPKVEGQIVLPVPYREQVLRTAHLAPMAGHFGVSRTSAAIKRRFFWPGMSQDIRDMCRRCQVCQKTTPKYSPKAPLMPLPIIRTPFTRIAMDLIGPLPATSEGHRYILTICDYGTRYPEAVPLKSITSRDIAQQLILLFARFGAPEEILTDRGQNFTSVFMTELFQLMDIKPIKTSAYHPQTDGMVERFNGTLKTGIRKYIQDHGGEWHHALPFVLWAFREVPHTVTGLSPFELLFGRCPKGPLDVLKHEWNGSGAKSLNIVSYMRETYDRLEQAQLLASQNESKAKQDMATYYDKGARAQLYCVGDQVLIMKPNSKVKLQAQWRGPYSITEKLSDVTYRVLKPGRTKPFVYHTNFLKRWNSPSAVCMTAETIINDDEFPSWEIHADEGAVVVNDQLSTEKAAQLRRLVSEYEEMFSNKPGRTQCAEISINTGDAKPVFTPPYRLPHAQKPVLDKEIEDMLREGIISPSTSRWGSPMMLVDKKDGSSRPVVDYRKVNKITVAEPYPMPRIDDTIDQMAGAAYISTLDLTKGYWQVPVAEDSKHKTAFVTDRGKFQFNFMPFGLMGAPATFQRLMNDLFSDVSSFVSAYIDDVVIHSASWEDHMIHLEEVFHRIHKAGLTVKARKCQLAMHECLFLGHMVGRGRVKPEAAKVMAITDFRTPKTKRDVRAFVGLANYYRHFVGNFATIATPLTDLTRDSCPDKIAQWEPAHQKAFDTLKKALSSETVLQAPDPNLPFTLFTDASDRGIGAVLSQPNPKGILQPVSFFSKKLLPRQQNYATVDRECLAVVDAIRFFAVYLTGVHFTVVTDHMCLRWLDSVKDLGGRRTRWSLSLQPFDFEVVHRPGSEHANADGLSRQAWPSSELSSAAPEFFLSSSNLERVGGNVVKPSEEQERNNNTLPCIEDARGQQSRGVAKRQEGEELQP